METDSQVYDWVSANEWEKHCHSNSALAQYSWSSGLGSGKMLDWIKTNMSLSLVWQQGRSFPRETQYRREELVLLHL